MRELIYSYHINILGKDSIKYYYAAMLSCNDQFLYIIYSTTDKNFVLKVNELGPFSGNYKDAVSCNIIHYFYSKENDPKFLRLFGGFFQPYYNYSKNHITDSTFNYYSNNENNTAILDNFIREHKNKEYSRDDFIQLLIKLDTDFNDNLSDDDINSLTKIHLKKYRDNYYVLKDIDDFYKYCRPYYADFSDTEIEGLKFIKKNNRINKDIIRTLYKVFAVSNHFRCPETSLAYNKLVKDIVVKDYMIRQNPNDNLLSSNYITIPDDTFNQYINNLTVGQLNKIVSKLPVHNDSKLLMEISDKIIHNNKDYIFSYEFISDYFSNNEDKLVNTPEDSRDLLQSFLVYYRKIYPCSVFVLMNYFDTISSISHKELNDLISIFIVNNDLWCNDNNGCDFIVFKLLNNGASPINILRIIQEAVTFEGSVSFDDWLLFVNHYEDYKDMPVSWWSQLIK